MSPAKHAKGRENVLLIFVWFAWFAGDGSKLRKSVNNGVIRG